MVTQDSSTVEVNDTYNAVENDENQYVDARPTVRELNAHGIECVPGIKDSKAAAVSGYYERNIPLEEFKPNHDVLIKTGEASGWLVDVEGDVSEAVRALKVLPRTLRSGRGLNLTAHNWFRAEGAKTEKFLDTDGSMLLEVRADKCITKIKGTHPSGDEYGFEGGFDYEKIITIDAEELRLLAVRAATVALIARHLPTSGLNEYAKAYTGYLLRHLDSEVVQEMLHEAWDIRGALTKKAEADIDYLIDKTPDKLENEEHIPGYTALNDLVVGVPDLLAKWWGFNVELSAEEIAELERRERVRRAKEAWPACKGIAKSPDVLSELVRSLKAEGVAGEEKNAKLVYVVATSRLLDKPINLVAKAPSSVGKNYLVDSVLSRVPKDSFIELTGMSEKALYYNDADYKHKILYIAENAGINNENLDYAIRSLLSEGRLKYLTVEKINGQMVPREIVKEGPTGMIQTTTRAKLYHDNETRLLSVSLNDTPEQTDRVMDSIAEDDIRDPVDLKPWRAFQTWLEGQDNRVWIPFSKALSKEIKGSNIRLRRDFKTLLGAIRTIAVLHQARRARDYKGRIVAEYRDYEAAKDLLDVTLSEGIGATVDTPIRETVEAVAKLSESSERTYYGTVHNWVPQKELVPYLNIDKSAVSKRVNKALSDGWLEDLSGKGERSKKLVLGEPLPGENSTILPEPDELARTHYSLVLNSFLVSCVCGGKEGRKLLGKLTANLVDHDGETIRVFPSLNPLGSVRNLEECGLNKLNTAIEGHENSAENDDVAYPSETEETGKLNYKVPENVTKSRSVEETVSRGQETKLEGVKKHFGFCVCGGSIDSPYEYNCQECRDREDCPECGTKLDHDWYCDVCRMYYCNRCHEATVEMYNDTCPACIGVNKEELEPWEVMREEEMMDGVEPESYA